MSLLIPDNEIHNLYLDGQRVKAAYSDGEKVWTQKHRVDWLLDDEPRTVIKTEYVTDGQSAAPPAGRHWLNNYCSYLVNSWDKLYDSILADTEIHAQSKTTALYIFRNGYGVNSCLSADISGDPDLNPFEFTEAISFRDSTSNTDYGSAEEGQISQGEILCSHTGGTSTSDPETFRAARYCAALLDAGLIRAAGFTKLRFTGSYRFSEGSAYRAANLRVAFVSLQSTAAVSTSTASGVLSDNNWQVSHNVNGTGTSAVSAVSGDINAALDIPESGSFYVIIGELTKAFKGTGEIRIDNMWVE